MRLAPSGASYPHSQAEKSIVTYTAKNKTAGNASEAVGAMAADYMRKKGEGGGGAMAAPTHILPSHYVLPCIPRLEGGGDELPAHTPHTFRLPHTIPLPTLCPQPSGRRMRTMSCRRGPGSPSSSQHFAARAC